MIPRYYQLAAHAAAWCYLRTQAGNPLIVLPTGAGKSLVIAMLIEQAIEYDARVIVLQHRKELIEQNADKIQTLCPSLSIGINSAGLGQRDYDGPVVFAGIQSVYRNAPDFGRRELILIDEVHLVGDSESSMYGRFLADLMLINEKARIVGLTATPYRTGEGTICGPDKMFQKICYESKTGTLIEEGYLCNLTNQSTQHEVDLTNVRTSRGDYNESDMQRAFMSNDLVSEACAEIVEKCVDRHSILIFSSGVDHAFAIGDTLATLTGDTVRVITGETLAIERSQWLSDFKDGHLRWLVNCMVLTTGFDAPCIDALAVLRATTSAVLFAQMVGRALRKHESKTDALILDFGGNIRRHGPIDSDDYGTEVKLPGEGSAPKKNCPNCESAVAISAQICEDCGFKFPLRTADKHDSNADENSTLIGQSEPEEWVVVGCSWTKWTKKKEPDKPPTLRVMYDCQPDDAVGNLTNESISEWVCFEHAGYAGKKAQAWWDSHSIADCPETVDEAVKLLDRGVCRMPFQMTTKVNGKWRSITEQSFSHDRPAEDEWAAEAQEVPDDYVFEDDEVPF